MAKRRSYKRKVKKHLRKAPIIVTLLIILAAIGLFLHMYGDKIFDRTPPSEPTEGENLGESYFHMIDVGQGDAILITTESGNMLIDSGDLSSTSRKQLVDYLSAKNITSFEYVVFTHTDADHIGSGDYIVNNYDVKTVIMPDFQATSATFGRLVDAIENKNVDLILIGEDEDCEKAGYSFKLGPVTNTIVAPTQMFNTSNDMSIVIKAVHGETSILLTGDAEKKSEAAMLKLYKKGELDCDILKVGHHGAKTSTSQDFLNAVSPEAVLISCGQGNKHGHPHKETMDKFTAGKMSVYRTDKNGSIVVKTDGKVYTIETEQ